MSFTLLNALKKVLRVKSDIINMKSPALGAMPKISIVIVTYNNLEYTRLCLESIENYTDYPNYEVIVVDNASNDGSATFLDDYQINHSNMVLIKNTVNTGFAPANNQGVAASNGAYVVFLNNDTIVTPGWLKGLFSHLAANTSVGMVGPVTNAIGNEAKVDIDYTDLQDINSFAIRRAKTYHGQSFEIRVLALYCAMISRKLFDEVGGLDERYQIGMFEDDDLALKIAKSGLKCICAEDVFIHHFHGASFKNLSDAENQRIFHENREKFEKKWGVQWIPHQHRK